MNQGPFVHSENDCLHAVGKEHLFGDAAVLGRQAGVIWSHLGSKLTQRGDGRRARSFKEDTEDDDVASAGCLSGSTLPELSSS